MDTMGDGNSDSGVHIGTFLVFRGTLQFYSVCRVDKATTMRLLVSHQLPAPKFSFAHAHSLLHEMVAWLF